MKNVLALVALVALAVPAQAAEVYRWIEGATVVYSDQPPQDSAIITAMPGAERLPAVTAPDATLTAPSETEMVVPIGRATVDEILELSGVRAQMAGIAGWLGAEYLPRPGQLGERDSARVAQIVGRHFVPERLYTTIHDELGRQVDAKQLAAMASWFRSPLGRRIATLEVAAARPEAAPAIAAFAAGLKTSPPTPARLDLVQRLDWITGASDDTTDFALAIAGSVARAAATAAPAEQRTRVGIVERRVEEMRGQTGAVIGAAVLTQMVYTYSPLTDVELKAYVDFLASPAGRAYARTSHLALLRAVREAADRTAIEIVQAVPLQRWAAAQRTVAPPAR